MLGAIYLGGWQVSILGSLQRIVLASGLLSPHVVAPTQKVSFDFKLRDAEGHTFSFTKHEGEVVFLNFWATWCPPCIAEMPDIHSLYLEMKEEATFAMISVDKDPQKALDFIAKKGYTFPVYFLTDPLPAGYEIRAIPTTYLIDKNQKVRTENHGMAKYNTAKFRRLISSLQEEPLPKD